MFSVPLTGLWRPGQVHIAWTASSRPFIPEIESTIERTWEQASRRPGIHLFDGPMCRLESWQTRADELHLALSPTSYRIFVGTNLNNAGRIARTHGRQALANPIGLSAVLLTSDGYLLLGRRNASVAYYPGRVHPFAGCLEPGQPTDVFQDVRRELREELALAGPEVEDLVCHGIAEDESLLQPEMIFSVRAAGTRRQIEARLDATEHRGTWHVGATSELIGAALGSPEPFTPVAVAALLLWGRWAFGDRWFAANAPRKRYDPEAQRS